MIGNQGKLARVRDATERPKEDYMAHFYEQTPNNHSTMLKFVLSHIGSRKVERATVESYKGHHSALSRKTLEVTGMARDLVCVGPIKQFSQFKVFFLSIQIGNV